MKKLFYSLAVIAVISILSSCTPSPEELILGNWTLNKVEALNLDELATQSVELQKTLIDGQIASVEEQIATIEDEEEKATYQAQLEVLKTQKGEITVEKIKEEAKKGFEEMVGTISFTFTEDGKVNAQGKTSDWAISEDGTTITITTEGNDPTVLTIEELNATTFAFSSEEGEGDNVAKMKMTFKKGEATDDGGEETEEEETH